VLFKLKISDNLVLCKIQRAWICNRYIWDLWLCSSWPSTFWSYYKYDGQGALVVGVAFVLCHAVISSCMAASGWDIIWSEQSAFFAV